MKKGASHVGHSLFLPVRLAVYFLFVGHTQCVGIVLPTQTLPWHISIAAAGFMVPVACFVFFIYDTFFPPDPSFFSSF